jgi:hypothetical protein
MIIEIVTVIPDDNFKQKVSDLQPDKISFNLDKVKSVTNHGMGR